jgi:uncharacterized protein YdaU (DUF1376 family)
MNNVLQNIMYFINDNTILLICICGFLILVLIGYLIDSSIKARNLEKSISLTNKNNINTETDKFYNQTKEENVDIPVKENIEDSKEEFPKQEEIKEEPKEIIETKVEEPEEVKNEVLPDFIEQKPIEETKPQEEVVKVEEPKNNNKKLSEILGGINKNTETKIEDNSVDNELDRIMKKLDSNKDRTLDETTDFNNMF